MRNRLATCFAAVTALLVISPVMSGRHGVSDYDVANVIKPRSGARSSLSSLFARNPSRSPRIRRLSRRRTWHVTVAQFLFVNPHSLLGSTRKNDQGKIEEWQVELQSPKHAVEEGHWRKDTVKTGEQITILSCPAGNRSKTILVRKVVLSNGEEFPGG